MLVRNLVCALAFAAAATPQAVLAQQPNNPFFQVSPESAPPRPSVEIGRGRVDFQSYAQQRRVEALMPRIEKAVAAQLDHPAAAELIGLRTGRHEKAMVVCGVVESVSSAGERQRARFIARPDIATLETPANSQAFRAGWKSTGCGF